MADRSRLMIAGVFALHGASAGSFATRIPAIQERLHLSPGQLGLALVMPAVAGALTMPLASRLMHRYGSRLTTRVLMSFGVATLALPAVAPNLVGLCVALWICGAVMSMADVAMNAEGVEIENTLGKSIMSSLHGMWSVGGLLASGVGALAAHQHIPPYVHLPIVAGVLVVLVQLVCRKLPDFRPAVEEEPPPRFALPPADALLIGLVGFCAVFAEGAGTDWSGVFLRDTVSAAPATAALGYGVFAGTMALTRLVGDLVVARIGVVATVRVAGVIAVAGTALIAFAVNAPMVFAGLALTGTGIAVVVPLAFGAAGKRGTNPSRSIAGVATLTYTAGLIAPAVTGAIAQATSLRIAFGLIGVLVLVLVPGAVALRPRVVSVPAGTRGR